MTARKCSIVGQLVKLHAGWQPALQAGYQPAAGCQPAPHEKEHLHAVAALDAGDGRSEIRRPGGEGRRGVCGMRWQDRISRYWIFPAGRNCAMRGRKRLPEERTQIAGSKDGGWVYTGRHRGDLKWEAPASTG